VPKDALLAQTIAQLLVVREGVAPAYVPTPAGPPAPVATREQFAAVVTARLNEVRAAARLAPLHLVPAQSRVNGRLAATLVTAMSAGDQQKTNKITLGLMAGWDVGAYIRDGDILASLSLATNDAAAWLGDALERPIARNVLLGPNWRLVAVGPAIAEGGGLAAAITTYATFDGVDHRADADRVFAVIANHRAARGLPPPVRIARLEPLEQALARIGAGEQPADVADDLLQSSAHALQSGVRGFVFETIDPEEMPPPAELLRPTAPRLAVGVTHHRVPGAAWGQTIVFIVMVDDGAAGAPANMVRLEGSSSG
jgi:hypothetical protein